MSKETYRHYEFLCEQEKFSHRYRCVFVAHFPFQPENFFPTDDAIRRVCGDAVNSDLDFLGLLNNLTMCSDIPQTLVCIERRHAEKFRSGI